MALYSVNRWAGPVAPSDIFSINFVGGYLDKSHVHAYEFDPVFQTYTPIAFTLTGPFTLTGATVASGKELVVRRETPALPAVDFVNGARLSSSNLDSATQQGILLAAEAVDAGNMANIQDFSDAVLAVAAQVAAAIQAAQDAGDSANDAMSQALAAANSATAASGSAGNAAASASAASGSASAAAGSASAASSSASAAAGSASAASGSATAAAGSASDAANSKTLANASYLDAQSQATAAASSASAASSSASTASTQAGNASTSAYNAQTSALNAAASEQATATNLSMSMVANCRLVWYGGSTIALQPCKGKTIWINGVVRPLQSGGAQLNVSSSSTVYNVMAYWTGSAVAIKLSTSTIFYNNAIGLWQNSALETCVGWVRGDSLSIGGGMQQETAGVLSAYNSAPHRYATAIGITSGTWNGGNYTLSSSGILLGPASVFEIEGHFTLMTTPADRVGDLNLVIGTTTLVGKARNTHEAAYSWRTYHARWGIVRGVDESAAWFTMVAQYVAISTGGGTFSSLGDPDLLQVTTYTDR